MKKYLKFEYLYLVVILIWQPLQIFVLKVDAGGRMITLLTIIIISSLLYEKRLLSLFKKPLVIWFCWIIYVFINGFFNGYGFDMPTYSFVTFMIVPLVVMIVISSVKQKNRWILLDVLSVGMVISLLLIFLFDKSDSEYYDRLGTDLNSNEIGQMALVILMLFYYIFFSNRMSFLKLILLSLIPVIIIVKTGSRTAFGGLLMLALTHIAVNRSNNWLKNLVKYLGVILFLFFSIIFVLNDTPLGERILSTTEEGEEIGLETGNDFLNKFGDRGYFYYHGWIVFLENPLFGVGLGNFINHNENSMVQHSEYMVELSELGIIGFAIFFLFFLFIYMDLFRIYGIFGNKKYVRLFTIYLFIILLMFSSIPLNNKPYIFVVFGIIIGFIKDEKQRIVKIDELSRYLKKSSLFKH